MRNPSGTAKRSAAAGGGEELPASRVGGRKVVFRYFAAAWIRLTDAAPLAQETMLTFHTQHPALRIGRRSTGTALLYLAGSVKSHDAGR
jgi:hypothetical protein